MSRQPGAAADARPLSLVTLSLLAITVGVIAGIGAALFRALIAAIHNLMFLGHWSFSYDANQFTPQSPWGPLVILVPVLGGLVVTFLVTNFAPEARGHGVPEVMDAIYYREGVIRPLVAAVKSLASAAAIGSGSSVGREGPIIQIGASFGSTIGQVVRMAPWQRITLIAAGAGAGIAATFNTPIGGVLFAVELMMPEVSVRTFLPVALATGTATFVGRQFFGSHPAFLVPAPAALVSQPLSLAGLVLCALLGVLIGLAATAFVRALHSSERRFERVGNPYFRHIAGMLAVGALMYALDLALGQYFVDGVGYATIQAILSNSLFPAGVLGALGFALLFACKLAATSLSLGSGSSGGIFSPSLFMGATIGAAFGALVHAVHPVSGIDIPGFAMVGMAAMVGGGTGAAMTAVTMIFEMTLDYDIVMPMIVAVAISIGIRRLLSRENIYTIKLVERRHFIPKALHANMFLVRRAGEVMDREAAVLPASASFREFLARPGTAGGIRHVVVTRDGHIVGVQRVNTALPRLDLGAAAAAGGPTLGEVAQRRFTIARESDIMFEVIGRMWRHGAAIAVVVDSRRRVPTADDVVGVVTKEHIADSVAESLGAYRE